MLCDECIMTIGKSLSNDSIKVLETIIKEQNISRTKIQQQTQLTYAYTGKALDELRNKFLINYEIVGRSRKYGLTKVGYRLAQLSMEVD